MEILNIHGLCKRYPSFELKDVSFTMQSGTIMGFVALHRRRWVMGLEFGGAW